ncbi:hypothetical protein BBAL3_2982 [Brevundimonas sp. BAL3]|nr:hypothetical protein BBAL3_2982 [Brevundimonas sp. BAL3]
MPHLRPGIVQPGQVQGHFGADETIRNMVGLVIAGAGPVQPDVLP